VSVFHKKAPPTFSGELAGVFMCSTQPAIAVSMLEDFPIFF
jgi:hypothetical protein